MDLQKMIDSVPHWYHEFEFAPGIVTPGARDSRTLLRVLQLPDNLSGKRVLDLGARDGFFSFECERRGAEVVPIDYVPAEQTGFPIAKQILGSKLDLLRGNVYDLTPEKYGQFDIVLMLGLLYHLPDPMRALDIVFSVMKPKGHLFLETVIIDESLPQDLAHQPFMLFYPRDTKNRDFTNYWGMTEACAVALLEENNFRVLSTALDGERGLLVAVKEATSRDYYTEISRGLVK